jgi:hypothetical protein
MENNHDSNNNPRRRTFENFRDEGDNIPSELHSSTQLPTTGHEFRHRPWIGRRDEINHELDTLPRDDEHSNDVNSDQRIPGVDADGVGPSFSNRSWTLEEIEGRYRQALTRLASHQSFSEREQLNRQPGLQRDVNSFLLNEERDDHPPPSSSSPDSYSLGTENVLPNLYVPPGPQGIDPNAHFSDVFEHFMASPISPSTHSEDSEYPGPRDSLGIDPIDFLGNSYGTSAYLASLMISSSDSEESVDLGSEDSGSSDAELDDLDVYGRHGIEPAEFRWDAFLTSHPDLLDNSDFEGLQTPPSSPGSSLASEGEIGYFLDREGDNRIFFSYHLPRDDVEPTLADVLAQMEENIEHWDINAPSEEDSPFYVLLYTSQDTL